MDKFIEKEVKSNFAKPKATEMKFCNCDLEMSGKHKVGCSEIERPKPAESSTMSAWRAEEVKNWTQALANLRQMIISEVSQRHFQPEMDAIQDKIRSLLGIADDK